MGDRSACTDRPHYSPCAWMQRLCVRVGTDLQKSNICLEAGPCQVLQVVHIGKVHQLCLTLKNVHHLTSTIKRIHDGWST